MLLTRSMKGNVKDGMEAAVIPGKCDCLSFNHPWKVSGSYFTFEELVSTTTACRSRG